MQAAAYPDGRIEITDSMVSQMTDDELAFVVAHEVAHIEKKHTNVHNAIIETEITALKAGLQVADKQQKENGAGILKRAATQIIAGTVGFAGVIVSSKQLSQRHESEADNRAVDLSRKAGYDPAAGKSALTKLYGGNLPATGILHEVLGTHPAPRKRGKNVEDAAKKKGQIGFGD